MADVQSFAALRYTIDRIGGSLSGVLAPPYDVLDQADKDALLARNARNIVAVDLPHIPPKSAGPAETYAAAAELLQEWRQSGVLACDPRPALYVYHQTFEHDGRPFVRRMFIARVRLRAFSDGVILPHEKTFGGPKEDRLALMKAARCQLSPVFGLYADPRDEIGRAFASAVAAPPDATGTLDGVENSVRAVTDRAVVEKVSSYLSDQRIYIADGHHRYGTALMYRDWLAGQLGGELPRDHPAQFVMFVLASMDDPGCLILPYHRALAPITADELLDLWKPGTEPTSPAKADLTIVDGRSERETPIRFTNRSILRRLEPSEVNPWYELDYAYLHRYLIDELLLKKCGERAPKIHYEKSTENARDVASAESGVALLTRATPMAHLRAVSEAGGLMPQKSTYFHPKLATGVAMYPLE